MNVAIRRAGLAILSRGHLATAVWTAIGLAVLRTALAGLGQLALAIAAIVLAIPGTLHRPIGAIDRFVVIAAAIRTRIGLAILGTAHAVFGDLTLPIGAGSGAVLRTHARLALLTAVVAAGAGQAIG